MPIPTASGPDIQSCIDRCIDLRLSSIDAQLSSALRQGDTSGFFALWSGAVEGGLLDQAECRGPDRVRCSGRGNPEFVMRTPGWVAKVDTHHAECKAHSGDLEVPLKGKALLAA
eukprot:7843851-Alexandrium_andersonii.AAC.1